MTEKAEEYRTSIRSEHDEQVAVFDWATIMSNRHPDLELLYAIPNGANKSMATARWFKEEGLRSGVPDMCLPVPRRDLHALYIEMKSATGSVSPKQRLWINRLLENENFATVCYSAEEAIKILKWYLEIEE